MFKKDLRQLIIYSIGSMSQTALGFLLLPLYLNQLTTAEYGIINILLTINSVINLIAGAGILSGLSRLYYEQDTETRRNLAGMVLIWMGSIALLMLIFINAAAAALSQWLFQTTAYQTAIQAAGGLLLVTALQSSCYILLRLEKRAGAFVVISISGFLTDLGLKLYLIGGLHLSVQGYFISSLVSTSLTLLIAGLALRRELRFRLQWKLLQNLLELGIPFLFTGLGMWILDISDRLILNAFAGQESVGIYTLGYKFASIFNIVILGPLSLFWTPFIFSRSATEGPEAIRKTSARALPLLTLVGGLILILIATGAPDIIRLMSDKSDYLLATPMIPFLALAPFLYMLSYPAGSAILQSKQVRYSGYSMLIAATINVLLNLTLVPQISFYGSTISTVAGYLALCGLQYLWAHKVFPIHYNWSRVVRILICMAGTLGIISQLSLDTLPPLLSFLIHESLGILLFAGSTWLIGGVRFNDLLWVRQIIRPQTAPNSESLA